MTEETQVERAGIDVLEAMATTRAIRRFRVDEPVADRDLARILFAASRAPTGSNRQTFRFLVLRDGPRAAEAKALLGQAARDAWHAKRVADGYESGSAIDGDSPKARMARAMDDFVANFERIPVVIVACMIRYRRPHPGEGSNIFPACQNLLVAARSLGYGGVLTAWHAGVEDELRSVLSIPDEAAVAATIPLGRPAGHHGPVRRRPLHQVVYEDVWGAEAAWAVDPPGTRFTAAGPPGTPGRGQPG